MMRPLPTPCFAAFQVSVRRIHLHSLERIEARGLCAVKAHPSCRHTGGGGREGLKLRRKSCPFQVQHLRRGFFVAVGLGKGLLQDVAFDTADGLLEIEALIGHCYHWLKAGPQGSGGQA
jgi:hypothetical protein